jgi:crotonobetainyl-CoA:carnitine CoA-transferase CaiB-like acyl-CoA transferase
MAQPELKTDTRFSTTVSRLHNYAELQALIAAWVCTKTTSDVLNQLSARKIPVSNYREIAETLDDPQLQHRNMITEVKDEGGSLKVPNTPFLFSHTHAAIRPQVARIGEHNQAVFRDELGLDPQTFTVL